MNLVDPSAGKIGKRRQVLCGREPSRLEPPPSGSARLHNHEPPSRRPFIASRDHGVVDVLVSGKPTEHRLPQHTDKSVPAVLDGAGIGEPLAGQIRKTQCVVEFAVGKQAGI